MKPKNIPCDKIIIFGTSLGSGPSVFISSRKEYQFRGLILQSPFLSVVRIKVNIQNKIFFDMFPNIDRISFINCPIFLIHGKSDEVVPFEHSEIISKKCKEKKCNIYI